MGKLKSYKKQWLLTAQKKYENLFRDWFGHYMNIHYENGSDTRKCQICKNIAVGEVKFLEQVKSAFL